MAKYKSSVPEVPHILPKMMWINKDFLPCMHACMHACTGHIILGLWNFPDCAQGRLGRANITFCDRFINNCRGRQGSFTSFTVLPCPKLYQQQDWGNLRAKHKFHLKETRCTLINSKFWNPVNNNSSSKSVSIHSHHSWLNPDLTHFFFSFQNRYWTMWPLWFLVDLK